MLETVHSGSSSSKKNIYIDIFWKIYQLLSRKNRWIEAQTTLNEIPKHVKPQEIQF